MAEKLSTEKFEMPGYGSKSPLGKEGFAPPLKKNGEDEKLDKKILKESKKRLIKDKKEEFKSGDITRKEFRAAKKEIKGYTDVDAAKDHFNEADFKTVKQERREKRIKKKGDRRSEGSKMGQFIRRKTNPNKAR